MTRRAEQEFQQEFGSHTPASYRERLHGWYIEGYDGEFGVDYGDQPERTAEELAARRIGDAERIACTLLGKADPENGALAEWLRNLIANPVYTELLDRETENAILDGDNTEDREAYLLGVALRRHRRFGEPDTEYYETVARGLQTITTSLAAQITEYVQAVANHQAYQAWRNRS